MDTSARYNVTGIPHGPLYNMARSSNLLTRILKPFVPELIRRDVRLKPLPRIRFHDLRHTHASLLLAQGVHRKIVSERLGHSTVNITLDTYSHLLPGLQRDFANRFEALTLRQNQAEECT